MKEKISIITSGYFPVPAVLGGAVEALDENLVKQNDREGRLQLKIFSCFDKKAEKEAKKYQNTQFIFIKIPLFIKKIDKIIYYVANNILKKEKNLSYRYITQRLFYIIRVAQFLRKEDCGKIVLENHPTLFLTLKLFNNSEKYKNRYYYHLHNVVNNDYGCKNIIRNCRKIIGVSNYINDTLKQFLNDTYSTKYVVLKNKVDRDRFLVSIDDEKSEEFRIKYKIEKDDIVLLFTGRFSSEKGIRELLEAFRSVKIQNVKLLIVGSYYFGSQMVSHFEEEMKKLILSMSDRVKCTGFINYDKIPELYAFADIVVIPSVWDDPAPLTVIESLTSGKPLITTYSGGIPEYANPDVSIILEKNEFLISNLRSSIETLACNHNLRNEMKKKVKEYTREWTIESFYNDFCNLLES